MIERKKIPFVRRGDVVVILAVLALAIAVALGMALLAIGSESGSRLEVHTPSGIDYYSLSEDASFDVDSNGHILRVSISDGEARVDASDCPDGLCRRMGAISRAGESIVCVPARVKLVVSGESGGGDDAIAG